MRQARIGTRCRVVCALLLVLGCTSAFAEEGDEGEEFDSPLYGVTELWPATERLPSGWTARAEGEGSALALEQALHDLSREALLREDQVTIRARAAAGPDGALATIAILAAEAEPRALRAALDARTASGRWLLTEAGDRSRLLVVQADPAVARPLLAHLRVELVHELAQLASRTLRRALADQSPPRLWLARTYLGAAARMEPEAGPVRALEGEVGLALDQDDVAIRALRDALREGQAIPPRPALEVRAMGLLGHELLSRKDADLLKEARGLLQRAVTAEASEEDLEQRFNNRYNLACVFARLGDVEPALTALEASLRYAREHLAGIYPSAWRYARALDPDLAPLRSQPGFSALIERMKPSAPR